MLRLTLLSKAVISSSLFFAALPLAGWDRFLSGWRGCERLILNWGGPLSPVSPELAQALPAGGPRY